MTRYVIPELNGCTAGLRKSQEYLDRHRTELMSGASAAVAGKILAHEGAAAAMQVSMEQASQAAAAQEAKQSEFRPGGPPPPDHCRLRDVSNGPSQWKRHANVA